MKKFLFMGIALCCSLSGFAQEVVNCLIKTSIGDISIELYAKEAPLTVANFLAYVDADLYDNSSFYRVCNPTNEAKRDVKIEVIQGGNVSRDKSFEAIPLERTSTTGLTHEDGMLSMARTADINSATSHFFICVNSQPALDFGGKRNPDGQGFAAFGKVISGMELVKEIQNKESRQQRLLEPVVIYSIERIAAR